MTANREVPVGRLSPDQIRFTQASVSHRLSGGRTIDELAEGLRTGRIKPEDIQPIRVVEREGVLFSLDNRRLEAFRLAGVAIPFRMATPAEVDAERWKFTTTNNGTSIRVRGKST